MALGTAGFFKNGTLLIDDMGHPFQTEKLRAPRIPEIHIEFCVTAEIIWAVSSGEADYEKDCGMGLKFINLSRERSKLLGEYINSRLKN